MADPRRELAVELFQRAFQMQTEGELDLAAQLYRRSIEAHPTAEAYTYLGWTYRNQGKLEEAIRECRKAIELDPGYGNPYNDIGAYLIELGRPGEAIPWLEKAIRSERYEAYHYPWYNLGRVYASQDLYKRARQCFEHSLQIAPGYAPALEGLALLRRAVQ